VALDHRRVDDAGGVHAKPEHEPRCEEAEVGEGDT
jgi:hypothetical protein